jgi:tetratricopeptide (TPR) repeat protein
MDDFNVLEQRAKDLMDSGRLHDAIKIYLFMADGDRSLDAGYLAMKIGECYERIGDLHAAKYWYGRAVEENPEFPAYVEARRRLDSITIDDLLPQHN